MTKNPPAEYDSPWKQALYEYTSACLDFFFPQIHADINWERGYEFLNTELQQIVREAEEGKRVADVLVKVWRHNGEETFVLVHIEIQSQYESDFAERMFVYHTRIKGLYKNKKVASLGILADDNPTWQPSQYTDEIWGCRTLFEYPIAKLLDYESDWESLERSNNPFAAIVMAHLKTLETRQNSESRLQYKIAVVKGLYDRGYTREQILNLFRLIDWMMVLPKELETDFRQEIIRYQEERTMPYITSIERLAREEGIVQRGREAVLEVLEARFETVPSSLVETINQIEDTELLKTLHKRAITIISVADFQQIIEQLTEGSAG